MVAPAYPVLMPMCGTRTERMHALPSYEKTHFLD